MIKYHSKKFLSTATVAFTIFAVVHCASLSKRVQSNAPGWDPHSTPFPAVRRGDVVFQYRSEAAKGNVSVPDPYNWLENSDVSSFKQAQLAFTKTYLDKLEDLDVIRSAIKDADSYTPLYAPRPYGPKDDLSYLYDFKEKGAAYSRSYIAKQKDLDDAARTKFATLPGKVLIDDSLLGGKITWQQQISPDGTKVLYSIVDPDTYANIKLFVRDVSNPLTDKSQKIQEGGYGHYPDVVSNIHASTESWSGDSKSFFYSDSDGNVRYHVLGTEVKDDPVLVKPNTDSEGFWWSKISDDQRYVFVTGVADSFDGRKMYAASLDQKISGPIKWVPISTDYDFSWNYVASVGDDLYFETTKDAPNHQIVRITLDFSKAVLTDDFNTFTQGAESVTAILQRPDAKMTNLASYDNDKILITYEKDDAVELIAFSLTTGAQLQQVALDTPSTSVSLQAFPSSTDAYVQLDSLSSPSNLYHLKWDHAKNRFSSQLAYQQLDGVIDPNKYVVERQMAPSKTGNDEIPFYVLHRKDMKLDGSHPVIINFYGAYGFNWQSGYDAQHFAFVHLYNAVYILAAPRGGGDKGEDWHRAGMLNNKQNTFDDIISVAQYAIDQKWTSPGKLILDVQYAGATASAAIVNQAPEGLFGAYIGFSGIYDLLRLDRSTDKAVRIAEYGDPSDPKAFDWLRKFSPLHNIDSHKAYPTILIYPPADGGAIEPWHIYKYISELQYQLPNNPNPLLLGNANDTQEDRSVIAFGLAAHTIGFKRAN
ncbi:uncharacterized protein FA14DRAFT_159169 [Meira miltonrushii]|uniref:Prolyl endopeptidase n=1 Tax=Meira miltonrushii TaxID=1280837 RepID=A0A316VGR9_9BASI|nr:uncharacterized protein FA14DRAFT_159169 [Meira miltonrushii]PWN36839.1 hypothetical protein FA14DRAFT_159169 [Meira miltonrushii]